MYRLLVTNIQQHYPVGRGGHVFPPASTVEVLVHSVSDYLQIKACRYLKLKVLETPDGPVLAPVPDLPASIQPIEPPEFGTHTTGFLDRGWLEEQLVSDLRLLAEQMDVEVPSRATKAELIAALAAVPVGYPEGDDDSGTGDDPVGGVRDTEPGAGDDEPTV